MWLLRLKSGLEVTEQELSCWDNVPLNAEIASLAMTLERKDAKPYVIEYEGYEEYCCSRVGVSVQGGPSLQCVGYDVMVSKNGMVLEHEILTEGMRLKMYPRDKCEVPEKYFRRGSV